MAIAVVVGYYNTVARLVMCWNWYDLRLLECRRMADLGRGHASEDSDELGGSCLDTLYFEEGRVTVMQAIIFRANQLGAALLVPSRDT